MLGYVSRCNTSAEIWSALETSPFDLKLDQGFNISKLNYTIPKKGDLSITDYVHHMQGIADNIQAASHSISEDDLILHILNGLGSEYESIVVNLNVRADNITLQDVQYEFQTHEMRLQQPSHPNLPEYVNFTPAAHLVTKRPFSVDNSGARDFSSYDNRGGFSRGRGRVIFLVNGPSCQIYGKNKHAIFQVF
ncbi:hypothetical protein DH2020_024341 [Rehmannia glutinosa]|uniref:Uncharacterized protein n=1 Tax=Rehmannia glutinosa TaxID=99300 RepID=A0ABR0W3J2_REHGL